MPIKQNQVVYVETLSEFNENEAMIFLMNKEDFSLFLLGNLEACGRKLTSSPNSGNFKLIRYQNSVVCVFCLTRRGNLILQSSISEDWILEMILESCKEEDLRIEGLLGEWDFCQKLWALFKKKGIIHKDLFVSKQILYSIKLGEKTLSHDPNIRLLKAEDYIQWQPLRIAYLLEEGLPNDLSAEQLYDQFLERVHAKIAWGYFLEGTLLAMAELNAKAKNLGQVGGVYTTPKARKKGFAQSVMRTLMKDALDLHKICKLIIFTGETNLKAKKLYESLDVHPVGYYALMFGENHTI